MLEPAQRRRCSDSATGWKIRASNSGISKRVLPSPKLPEPVWCSHIVLFNGQQGYFSRLKRPGLKVIHYPPYSAEFKEKWKYTSASPCITMEWTRKSYLYPSVLTSNVMHQPFQLRQNKSSEMCISGFQYLKVRAGKSLSDTATAC